MPTRSTSPFSDERRTSRRTLFGKKATALAEAPCSEATRRRRARRPPSQRAPPRAHLCSAPRRAASFGRGALAQAPPRNRWPRNVEGKTGKERGFQLEASLSRLLSVPFLSLPPFAYPFQVAGDLASVVGYRELLWDPRILPAGHAHSEVHKQGHMTTGHSVET